MTSGCRLARARVQSGGQTGRAGADDDDVTVMALDSRESGIGNWKWAIGMVIDSRLPNSRFRFSEVLVDDLLEVFLRREADDRLDDLAALEEQQRRDAANLELERGVRDCRRRSACRPSPCPVVGRQRVDRRRQALARAAPLGPEIHEHRPGRLQHRLVELPSVNVCTLVCTFSVAIVSP